MLVLSRKESERIRLGDSIVVTVVRVSGGKVRLGIEAPADMVVLREELSDRSTSTPKADLTPNAGLTPNVGLTPVVADMGFAPAVAE